MLYQLPITAETHSTTITTAPNARRRLTVAYSTVTTTAWGVNAHGQTYGVANADGTPDLIAVIATNGRDGYAYADQLADPRPMPTSPEQAIAENGHGARSVPVYESDGVTRIGSFVIGAGQPPE